MKNLLKEQEWQLKQKSAEVHLALFLPAYILGNGLGLTLCKLQVVFLRSRTIIH